MELTQTLINNSIINKEKKLNIGSNHTYGDLTENIKEYCNLLLNYKINKISTVAVLVNDKSEFDTVCLIYALMHIGITPVIIDSKIGESINDILEKENIKIVFYESIIKPECLKKSNIVIYEEQGDKCYVSVNTNINVKNKIKIKSLDWYLKLIGLNSTPSCICKLYSKENSNIIENDIVEDDVINNIKNVNDLKIDTIQTTLPLYKKEGFLYLNSALLNSINITNLNQFEMEKNINKILKDKPSTITIDKYMALELIVNPKFKNIDLSFLKTVLIDVEKKYASLIYDILFINGFKGEYIDCLSSNIYKEKVFSL